MYLSLFQHIMREKKNYHYFNYCITLADVCETHVFNKREVYLANRRGKFPAGGRAAVADIVSIL